MENVHQRQQDGDSALGRRFSRSSSAGRSGHPADARNAPTALRKSSGGRWISCLRLKGAGSLSLGRTMFSFDFAASQRGQWRGAPRPLQETPPRKGCDHFHSIATRFACYDFFVIQLNVIIFKDFKSVNFFFPIFASNFFFVRKLSTHRCVSTDRMIFTCRTHRAPLEKVPIFILFLNWKN